MSSKVHILKAISPQTLKERLDKNDPIFLIDVRENYERNLGSIPSVHIPMGEITDRMNEIPTDKELVIICRSGKRAEAVANLLSCEYACSNISILEGGLLEWKDTIDSTLILE